MVDWLRVPLDRPLDPSVARTIVVLSGAILLGLAALLVLAGTESGEPITAPEQRPALPSALSVPAEAVEGEAAEPRSPGHRQDPQDREGSAAARRADRALRAHRALQHVPYRAGGVRIALVGARGSRAVLRVSAPTKRAARRGWHRFLDRYRDSGRAYVPIFKAVGGGDG